MADDERRAGIEALRVIADADRFASILWARDIARAALDRVRDARGDDEGAHYSETYVRGLRDQRDDWRRIAQTLGYREAGPEWLEPWCDEHPDGDGRGCVACIGASHDAWMHRAKDAEARLAEVESAPSPQGEDHEASKTWQMTEDEREAVAAPFVAPPSRDGSVAVEDHEAGIEAAMKALTAHRTMPGPNMRQDAEDAIAAYLSRASPSRVSSVAVEDVRAQTVAEIVAAVRAGSDAARPNEAKGWPRAADFIEREFSPASTGDQEKNFERRAEIEAVARAITKARHGGREGFDPGPIDRVYAEAAVAVLDRVRDARGDDEACTCGASFGHVLGCPAGPSARSPQSEDHKREGQHAFEARMHGPSPSRDGSVAVEDARPFVVGAMREARAVLESESDEAAKARALRLLNDALGRLSRSTEFSPASAGDQAPEDDRST